MSFLGWMTLASAVLLVMAFATSYVRDLPISTAMLYLVLGVALGPFGAELVAFDVEAHANIVEHVTELAVVIALFIGGLKLRLRWHDPAWYAALLLAGPVMLFSIGGIALIAHYALGLPAAAALLLGAVLAPTDPVLASTVAVNDADDCDRMRYGLSGEAGLNDGMAFPFIVLALGWSIHDGAGGWLVEWAAVRLVWAIPAALALGYVLGKLVGQLAIGLRSHQRDTNAPSDLLALALIGIAYVLAEAIHAWGFLAVFAAGLGLRAAEVKVVQQSPHPEAEVDDPAEHPPAEALVAARVKPEALEQPAVAAGVLVSETLSFGDTIERLVEVAMIVAIGIAVGSYWDWRAVPLAAALFLVIRPLATRAVLAFTPTTAPQRWLMGWFGIRGIGSLYYLGFVLAGGTAVAGLHEVVSLTVSTIALSIVVHGISATPLLQRYERSLA